MNDDFETYLDYRDWYERVAARDGGYVRTWASTREGRSGEDAFEELLRSLLAPHLRVLDAGCGSGDFTLRVAPRVRHVIGFDYANGMIRAAQANLVRSGARNAAFVHASSRDLPFEPASFDLIYSRRGPTSILLRPDLLAPGGWMVGIHSSRRDVIEARLAGAGLEGIRIDEYRAQERFPALADFARFWSRMPGHPDYLAPDQAEALADLARKHQDETGLVVEEWRIVWRGRKPAG